MSPRPLLLPVQYEVHYFSVGRVNLSAVSLNVNVRRRVGARMTQRQRNNVLGYVKVGRNGRPGMTRPIWRERLLL